MKDLKLNWPAMTKNNKERKYSMKNKQTRLWPVEKRDKKIKTTQIFHLYEMRR